MAAFGDPTHRVTPSQESGITGASLGGGYGAALAQWQDIKRQAGVVEWSEVDGAVVEALRACTDPEVRDATAASGVRSAHACALSVQVLERVMDGVAHVIVDDATELSVTAVHALLSVFGRKCPMLWLANPSFVRTLRTVLYTALPAVHLPLTCRVSRNTLAPFMQSRHFASGSRDAPALKHLRLCLQHTLQAPVNTEVFPAPAWRRHAASKSGQVPCEAATQVCFHSLLEQAIGSAALARVRARVLCAVGDLRSVTRLVAGSCGTRLVLPAMRKLGSASLRHRRQCGTLPPHWTRGACPTT